ncbi:parallel beta-helix repeat protein [Mucilaginibacter frigoritolerans]|jgi:parallel beta-helix repeat protein|uniref:Parallel beta-helix repeat protein n=1 Tax=Mucilaginibacter frigoritolerans TaxID=652788 RepID=A0A562U4A9_9SPHI|nr:right-handed parallel beta-helix repeat-containing protein [Mucilaginibacter frigoritolerans]TWJ00653.1 parallel beta-helix repeat protein [Mucilaginibacter frigoritolerans]
MSQKNPCWHCHVLAVVAISVLSFLSSCKKDQAVNADSSTTANSSITGTKKAAGAVATAGTLAQTYVVSGVVNLTGASNLTISGKSIAGGTVAAITLSNCHDVVISNCKLYNSTNVGIYLYNCYNITIKQNYFTNVSTGVYVDHSANGGIIVNSNQFLNMQGPLPRGQFVQFNNVIGINNQINSNIGENILGQSYPEDAISLYQCQGTATCPISVSGNEIRGGGPSTSGGGIMLGDSGGAYIVASGNTLVNPGQYGMAISGGSNNSIINNLIYGVSQSFTNIGLYVDPIGGYTITNSTVSGNRIKFYNAAGAVNGAWLASGVTTPSGWSTNNWDANIDASILPATLITYH